MEKFVQDAIDDLESISQLIGRELYEVWRLKGRLRCVKVFYLCGKKWSEDAGLNTSLCTMVETIHIHSLEILILCLKLREDNDAFLLSKRLEDIADEFIGRISNSIFPGIEELHQMFSDNPLRTNSSPAMEIEKVLDIIECLLQSIHGLFDLEDLEATVRFWKNFILFARLHGLGHMQMVDFFIHIGGLAVDAACFIFKNWYRNRSLADTSIRYKLMRRMEPEEFQVCGIYVRVLQEVLKLPPAKHPTERNHALMSAEFVDSLSFLLLTLLFRGTFFLDIFHHQMHKLHERLRFLSTTLKKHCDNIVELHQPTHGLIGPVICKGGIIIFYLFLRKEDEVSFFEKLGFCFSDFEENFKLIKAVDKETPGYPLALACPQTNLLGFLDFVSEKVKSFILHKVGSLGAAEKDKFQTLQNDLVVLRSFLFDVVKQRDQDEMLQSLYSRIAKVSYEIEFILDSLEVGCSLRSFDMLLNNITLEIEHTKAEVSEISFNSIGLAIKVQDTPKTYSNAPSAAKILEINEPMVGLDDEIQIIIDRLTRGTKQLDIVSVVGMAGLGKTTLAKNVYHHGAITAHFNIRSWCTVSQVYSKRSLLIEILSGTGYSSIGEDSKMREDDLALLLYQSLKGKNYLVVLDDVWDAEVWSILKISFPNDNKGNRILLTSRHENMALQIKPHSGNPHQLRLRTDIESWELFQMKIYFEECCPIEVLARAKAISQHCKGLPLMILVVAGFLSNMETGMWGEVEDILREGSGIVTDQCKETLDLSYRHLPNYLKQCFLYFGLFKEDLQIPTRELLQMWIAEGFVERTEREQQLEDVAQGYMLELIQRNLVMVAQTGSKGKVKYCVLHDLLHDFSRAKGIEESFMHRVHGHELNTYTEPDMSYRLSVYPEGVHEFMEPKLLWPRLRTLLIESHDKMFSQAHCWYGIIYNFCQYKLLRVLDLRKMGRFVFFPSVVQLLTHLKFLAFQVACLSVMIPPSIANLSNLETFIVLGGKELLLPNTLWNMRKLKHLQGRSHWVLPTEIAEHLFNLENLLTLSTVKFSCGLTMMKEVLRKFPNLRRLKCYLNQDEVRSMEDSLMLDFFSQLESLSVLGNGPFLWTCHHFPNQFQFPQNLKKLTAYCFYLTQSQISTIGELPNLEVLKLDQVMFTDDDWNIEEEGTFLKLKFLKLRLMALERWTAMDDNFPYLETLVLEYCRKLKELPSCLAESSTLRVIKVIDCPHAAASIKKIHEMQMDWGNEDLKVVTDFEAEEMNKHQESEDEESDHDDEVEIENEECDDDDEVEIKNDW
ncbi:OLC1v1012068C2 [Oldenlandia corymbosa var. corymbosa]|uniref:OLC1v1012068C2 n=1 Tax=Oldenlandia corymbosa var. corymbosa TaxID=529605 RepID=A0AAV1DV41_OLDCO|nr:OLC1v1012068C2 [Oldenlandia corymbosa var. corymbosa]